MSKLHLLCGKEADSPSSEPATDHLGAQCAQGPDGQLVALMLMNKES